MSAFEEIRYLDEALALDGEDVVLQRIISGTTYSVTCRAVVRGFAPHELIPGSGITQGASKVTISATEILAETWPNATAIDDAVAVDARIPRRGDKIVIGGVQRTVQGADPRSIDGQLVRIDMQVLG